MPPPHCGLWLAPVTVSISPALFRHLASPAWVSNPSCVPRSPGLEGAGREPGPATPQHRGTGCLGRNAQCAGAAPPSRARRGFPR